MTRDDLIAFEDSIAEEFNAGKIPYPVHLENGNEDALIRVFQDIAQDDWVFGSWRLHSKALLKGVSPDELRAAIYRGESMALRFPEHRVYGSAIVGGTIPIALGTAMSIKRRGGDERVWCFLGDMTAYTGIYHECCVYAQNWDLPICYVIEDNGVSVCTSTEEVWNDQDPETNLARKKNKFYLYKSRWPHSGAGKRINF